MEGDLHLCHVADVANPNPNPSPSPSPDPDPNPNPDPDQEEEGNWGEDSAELRNRLDKLLDL